MFACNRALAFIVTAAVLATTFTAMPSTSFAQQLSPDEQIYASLADLPAAERQNRLVEGAKKEGKLAIIQTLPLNYDERLKPAFEKKYPFIKMDSSRMGSQDGPERLVAEEAAGRHLTDLIVNAVPDSTVLIEQNLAARLRSPSLAKLRPGYEGFVDPQNRWVPVYWSEYGMSYNSNLLTGTQAPKDWFDLCKPEFNGNFSFEPAPIKHLVGMYELLGDKGIQDWLACVGKNKPIIMRGNTARVNLMLAGEHLVQGANYFYEGVRLKRDNPAVPFQPVYGAPIMGFAGAVIVNRNAPNPHAAALYADFMLDTEAQQLLHVEMRGPLTMEHPYMPKGIRIVAFNSQTIDLVNKVVGYWEKFIGK